MDDLDLIQEVRVDVTTTGAAEAKATVGELARGLDGLTVSQDKQAAAQLRVNRQLEATARQYDREYKAVQENAKALAVLDRARQQGLVGTEAYSRVQDALSSRLARQADAMQLASQAAQKLASVQAQAAQQAGQKLGSLSYSQGSVVSDQDIAKQRAALLPLVAAEQQYETQVLRLNQAVKAGVITEKERTALVGTARATLLNQTNEVRKAEEANARLTKGVGLNAYAWQNLSYQVNDVVTSLASGISPFQTLAQQGGQIYQILQSGQGGVGGALSAIKDRLLGISPLVGIFGLLAVGAIAAVAATIQLANAQRDVRLALLGVGQGAGVSADQIDLISRRAADSAKISVSAARDIELEFLKTGRVFGEVFEQGTIAAANFGKATKLDDKQAGAFVAQSLTTLGSGGYEELAKKAGNFDASLDRQVRSLLNSGNEMEAQRLVVERFGQAYAKVEEQLNFVDRTLGTAKRGWDSFWNAFQRGVSGDSRSVAQQLDETEKALSIRRGLSAQTGQADPQIKVLEEQAQRFRNAIKETGAESQKTAEGVRRNLDGLEKRAVTAAVPDLANIEKTRESLAQANKTLNALEIGGGSAEQIEAAKKAVAGYAAAERDFQAAGGPANMERAKANELMRAGLQSMQAVTPEQKAEAARQQALAETYGTVTSAQERTARANDAYNRSLAESRQGSVNASRAMNESTSTANQLAGATAQAGKSVEYLSAARKVDEQIAAGSIDKAERNKKIQEELQSRLAAVNLQMGERVRSARDQTSVQDTLNAKVAAGTIASAEAQRLLSTETELRKLAIERDAASGEAKVALTQRYNELAAATQAQLSAEDRARILSLTDGENDKIAVLQKEIELRGSSVMVRNRELAVLQATQQLENQRKGSSLTPEGIAYLDKVGLRSDLDTAKQQFERMAQEISSVVAGIFDDMFSHTTKGVAGVIDNFTRGISRLGTRFIEQNIISPLLGGQGGFGGGASFDFGKLVDGVQKGFEGGFSSTFAPLLEPRKGKDGQSLGFASSALGSGLMAGAAGGAIGYQSQNPFIGAAGGALAGFAVGNVPGAIIGGAAGLLGGLFGQSEAKKEAKKRIAEQLKALKEAYEAAKPEIAQLQASFRGEATGGTEGTIAQAFQQMLKANKTAADGGDQAGADKIAADFAAYTVRLRTEGSRRFEGLLKDMGAGQGVDGAFAQAANAAQTLGEALKNFVNDAKVYGEANQARATAAAREAALASLDVPTTLSETQTRLKAIAGTGTALNQVLVDLGMSATDAATAISERTAKAMDALRASFSADLDKKINDATGKGYLNEVADLLKERTSLLADAASLGTGSTKVESYFTAAAQKIVDEAELTGDAFADLVKAFPALSGQVHEFTAAVDTAAAKTAAAARALSYQDRLFAATNDTSTLYGQLVAYNRKAEQEIVEEQKAGGQAMADLVAAQNAERLKLESDYYQSSRDAQVQAFSQAQQAFDSFARNIKQYVDGLRAGSNSPLSPQTRLAAAQSQYNAQLTLAQGGNRDALDGITGYASDLLDAAKSFYASSSAFQTVFQQVTGQLTALPTQVSPEQFIVNAITDSKTATIAATQAMQAALKTAIDAGSGTATATALLPQFNSLTATTGGLLNYSQFVQATGGLATVSEQQAARTIFNAIDLDGDGQISKLELIRAQASAGNDLSNVGNGQLNQILGSTGTLNTRAEAGNGVLNAINVQTSATKDGVGASNTQLSAVNANGQDASRRIEAGNGILNAINALSSIQRDQLIALNSQFSLNSTLSINGQQLNNNIVTALNKIVYNTAGTWSAVQKGAVPAAYSTGGWVRGAGTATSDSIPAVLSNGEYVVKADVARMHGSLLETLNGTGTLNLRAMNDNAMAGMVMPGPMVMPMPAPSGMGSDALVAEIRALRAEVAQMRAERRADSRMVAGAVVTGAEHVGERVDGVKDAVDEGRRSDLLAA